MKTRIVIPARLKSSRFPNKLIKKINKITLIEHVCRRAKKLQYDSLIVATDSIEIKNIVEELNIEVWFSRKIFSNGTERIAKLSHDLEYSMNDIIINIQADEFNFTLSGVKKIIDYLKSKKSEGVATLIYKNNSNVDFNNSNHVKVVINSENNALYFSRAMIPFNASLNYYSHIGIYGYKNKTLKKYKSLSKSKNEINEKLEQLRFLWNNISIKCLQVKSNNSISINTLNDLKLIKKL